MNRDQVNSSSLQTWKDVLVSSRLFIKKIVGDAWFLFLSRLLLLSFNIFYLLSFDFFVSAGFLVTSFFVEFHFTNWTNINLGMDLSKMLNPCLTISQLSVLLSSVFGDKFGMNCNRTILCVTNSNLWMNRSAIIDE